MEYSKKDEGLEKKMKYVQPELISLDKKNCAEGGLPPAAACTSGSGPGGDCTAGAGVVALN